MLNNGIDRNKPYLIGITGGTASGKTTLTNKICENINESVTKFSFDSFYFGLPKNTNPDDYDFDNPNSVDIESVYRCALRLSQGKECKIPIYCFNTHSRLRDKFEIVKPKKIIIFEGIFSFYDKRIRDLFDLKIFIHCDTDILLGRRVLRDISERNRDVNEVLNRYNRFVKFDYEKYILPLMKYSDLIIPGGANNDIAMNFILDNLKNNFLNKVNIKKKKNSNVSKNMNNLNEKIKVPKNSENLINSITKLTKIDKELEFYFIKPFLKKIIKFSKKKIIKIFKNNLIFNEENKKKFRLNDNILLDNSNKRIFILTTNFLEEEDYKIIKDINFKNLNIPVFIISFVSNLDVCQKIVNINPLLNIINLSSDNIKSITLIDYFKKYNNLKIQIEDYWYNNI